MLLYNIESMAKKMEIDYQEVTSHIDHMGLRGSARENIIREYIKQLLPKRFAVGSGIITDAQGTQSRQQDFIIYDAFNSPSFLQMDSLSTVLPIESVYSTIEVKSCLTKAELEKCITNYKSVKDLVLSPFVSEFSPSRIYNQICGYVFSYTSDASLETVALNVQDLTKELPIDLQPTMICVLDKGLIVHVDKTNPLNILVSPSENTTWAIIENEKEKNLYIFYLLLQQHLNSAKNLPPDLFKYAYAEHVIDNTTINIPTEMIPKDIVLSFGSEKISGEELLFLQENHDLCYRRKNGLITPEDLARWGKTSEEVEEIFQKAISIMSRTGEEIKGYM